MVGLHDDELPLLFFPNITHARAYSRFSESEKKTPGLFWYRLAWGDGGQTVAGTYYAGTV